MSRILLFSYYFPPIGGAGAQRPLKFARYLHRNGHEVTILTGSGRTGAVWTPADPTLELDIPEGVQVLRVPGPEPAAPAGARARMERIVRIEPDWVRWWRDGVVGMADAIPRVDVIYTIMSPYSSAEASLDLGRKLGVGWIADLGDPWALDEMMVYPTRLHRRLELRRMGRMLGTASAIVMSTPEAVSQLLETFPELGSKPVVAIPNGYDSADFTGLEEPTRDPGTFRVVHTGYLHAELGMRQRSQSAFRRALGGAAPGVDILTRSHVFLLEAIDRLLARDPSIRDRLQVHFAGVLSQTDRAIAARSPVSVLHGYVSHAESIAMMRSADLLFLPLQNPPPGRRSSTVPGKTYEYLASGRPILGALPPGDARDIVEKSRRAILCRPDDVDALAEALGAAMTRDAVPVRDTEYAEQFSYENLAARVAAIVEQTLAPPPSRRTAPPRSATAGRAFAVLLVAYYFPPIGGAGVQRSLKFARYLPEYGCRPIVVTGRGLRSGRWTPIDTTLNSEVPQGTEVVRIARAEPADVAGWRERAHRWLRVPSRWSRWWVDSIVEAVSTVPDADVIVASASPYDTIEAVAKAAARLGKPWIADLRDPWALDEMLVYPSVAHRRLELTRMRRMLQSASGIVMNTPEAARRLRETFPELRDRHIVAIPNGYDAGDFAHPAPVERDPAKFRIVHTGYLHAELGLQRRQQSTLRRVLGGDVPGVDILTRSHFFLLQAIDLLLERDPSLRDRLEVHLAGVLTKSGRAIASRSAVTVLHGYVPHAQSIGLICSADLLFLPLQNVPPGRRSTTVPGKTYEYLASGRPILGAVPDGDARDLLLQAGHTVCRPDDIERIAEAIEAAVAARDAAEPEAEHDQAVVRSFERHRLTAQLADLVKLVVEEWPGASAVADARCEGRAAGQDELSTT